MNAEFASSLRLDDWRGELTLFHDKFSTRPTRMHRELTWDELSGAIAPKSGPLLSSSKDRLPYFLPCLLRPDAPLVGLTRLRAEAKGLALVGAMRSASHVTCASWITFDLDHCSDESIIDAIEKIKQVRLAVLIYSTFSHRAPDKGPRYRIVLPLDRPLNATDYGRFHRSLNDALFLGGADESGARLSQQQGTWGCPHERRSKAFRAQRDGFPVRVGELPTRSSAPAPRSILGTVSPHANDEITALPAAALPTIRRLEEASPFLVADSYPAWTRGLTAFKALAELGAEAIRRLALQFAATSPKDSTRMQNAFDSRYDPRQIFDTVNPQMTPQQAAACLLAQARDRAIQIVEKQRGKEVPDTEGTAAARYLAVNHPAIWLRYKAEARHG